MLVGHAQIAQRPPLGILGYLLLVAQIAQRLTAAWFKTDLLGHCPNCPTPTSLDAIGWQLDTPTSCYVITLRLHANGNHLQAWGGGSWRRQVTVTMGSQKIFNFFTHKPVSPLLTAVHTTYVRFISVLPC